MLSISSGHSSSYLLDAVAAGRENYYLDAVTEGEPPGRWYGAGAAAFGLVGEVNAQDMTALYERLIDPRDERFRDPERWHEAIRLGRAPGRYRTAEEILTDLLAAEPRATPERIEELRIEAGRQERHPVRFLDLTFSPPKSITIAHTAAWRAEIQAERRGDTAEAAFWAGRRQVIEDAHHTAVDEALSFGAQQYGYARLGHHGGAGGRWIDGHDLTVAVFFQHTNRDDEPQLHSHCAVLNRVACADGQYRTLDSQGLHRGRGAIGAVYDRAVTEQVASGLNMPMVSRVDGNGRELAAVSDPLIASQSSRARAIGPAAQQFVDAFTVRYGREPNARELSKLREQATLATRSAKNHHAPTSAQRIEQAHQAARAAVDGGLEHVAEQIRVAASAPLVAVQRWSEQAVISQALADVGAKQGVWSKADLARCVDAALPANLGLRPGETSRLIPGLVDKAVAVAQDVDGAGGTGAGAVSAYGAVTVTASTPAALPDELKLANGGSVFTPPGSSRYTTAEHLAGERILARTAVVRGHRAADPIAVDAWLADQPGRGLNLSVDQAAAVRGILAGGAAVDVLIGPAGTGKTRCAGAVAAAWADPALWGKDGPRGRVVGLATAQVAAEVLAGEGIASANISAWLGSQRRLAAGGAHPNDVAWRISPDDIVLVDESGMADTAALVDIQAQVSSAGAKLLFAGDHRQLAAIGAPGALRMLIGHAATYPLTEAHRFSQAWEAAASLGLREGRLDAVLAYDRHGRLRDCGTADEAERQAVNAWLGDTLTGQRSILVTASNEQAQRASARVRAELVALGRVTEAGVALGMDGNTAAVGDVVQARLNGWGLIGYAGNTTAPINRRCYQVTATTDDGGLVVTPVDGTSGPLTLPGSYVAEHVTLGYAATAHSAQGVTVDTAHVLIGSGSDPAGVYVGLSRGRDTNTAYVVTHAEAPDAEPGQAHDTPRRAPTVVLSELLERADRDLSATEETTQSIAAAHSAQTLVERTAERVRHVTAARIEATLDRLTAEGVLPEAHRQAFASDEASAQLGWLLRRAELAGHDIDQVITDALADRPLDGARSVAQVLHHRISDTLRGELPPTGDTFTERVPAAPGSTGEYLRQLGELADERRHELGTQAAEDVPPWASQALGPVPEDPAQRLEWEHKAGVIAAWREIADIADDTEAIGPAPAPGLTEHYAAYSAAWTAAGRPEAGREEAQLSDGALRCRVAARDREETRAPQYVVGEMRQANQAAATTRNSAILLSARADAEQDPAQAAGLRERAQLAWLEHEQAAVEAKTLERAHLARGRWYAESVHTRAAGERAERELASRGISVGAEDDRATARQWLQAEQAARAEDDPHRRVTEEDLIDEGNRPVEPDRAEQHAARRDDLDESDDRHSTSDDPGDETEQIITQAERAVQELADRASQEAAHQREQETGLAEEWEIAARETAVRRDFELAQQEQAEDGADLSD